MAGTGPGKGLETLTEDEALQFAGSVSVGRIALLVGGLIRVVPLNFALSGRDVVLRTTADTALLVAARAGQEATFEVDEIEDWSHSGWSVRISGRLLEVTDPAEVRAVLASDLQTWAGTTPDEVVRLVGEHVDGRRIRPGPGGTTIVYL